MPKLYLTGYEKESIEQFIKKLLAKGITTLIDVREIPLSRRHEFSKNHLRITLGRNGINYYHFPQLGSPSEIRRQLKEDSCNYLEFFQNYRLYIQKEKDDIVYVTQIVANSGKSSLLCFERNTDLCHRTILASEILNLNRNIEIIPL